MAFFLITPAIGWAWPALVPIVGAVAAALGYKHFAEPKGLLRGATSEALDKVRLERVPLDAVLAQVIAEEVGAEERIVLKRDEISLVFRKDALGKFFVDVLGPAAMTREALQQLGEEFARELVKKFAYHRITEQLERANVNVIEEKVEADGRITLRARKWE